jgi:hypothetical protein
VRHPVRAVGMVGGLSIGGRQALQRAGNEAKTALEVNLAQQKWHYFGFFDIYNILKIVNKILIQIIYFCIVQ